MCSQPAAPKKTNGDDFQRSDGMIDLRSDTVTRPDVHMRRAMFDAEVGDDGYGEDPTVNLMAHSKQRGGEVIVGDRSHILLWEQGGASQIAGLQLREVTNLPDGTLNMAELLRKFRPICPDPHEPHTSLVCIENTHNYCGGTVLPVEWIDQLGKLAKAKNVPLHMDGARVFNASVYLGVPVSRIVKHCDSVTFCLSKGLGAPIGAVLVGEKSFIEKARRIRKVLGGSMRQSGIVAAAGLYALDNCVERLADDHANAKKIADAIRETGSSHVTVDPETLQTNILLVNVNSPEINANDFAAELSKVYDDIEHRRPDVVASTAVRIAPIDDTNVRIVLHKNIGDEHVNAAIEKIKYVIGKVDRGRPG